MKQLLFVLISVILLSCKYQYQYNIEGTYRYHYKSTDDVEELVLNSDSTFIFNSYKTSCSGKWKYIHPNTILINCDDVDLMKKIQSGYMSLRYRDIEILSKNRLKLPITNNIKMKYVILEKE